MLQVNPSGTRLLFYERWNSEERMWTRVFTVNPDGSELTLAVDTGSHSHVAWLVDQRFVIYSASRGGFVVYEDGASEPSILLNFPADGHHSFLAGGDWMVSDTYPDSSGIQHPYLFHLPTRELFAVAHVVAPAHYRGIFRCDTHPRVSRSGRQLVIDSAHEGSRQMYLIDVGELIGRPSD